MNTRTLTKRPTVQLPTLPRLLLLALFFLAGVLLGQVLSGRVPDTTGDELRRYLEDYVRLGGEGAPTVQTALSALVIYFRYPLFAFLLGFASIGVVLLPCVTAAYGFFLSFSVCCFTAAFGVDGVLLALAVFGLRCMVTLPCYFLLAAAGLDGREAALATQLCFGVLQNKLLLDFYLGKFSNIPLKRMEGKVVQALRLGAYQMLFLTRIPHSAAVDRSVALTRAHCKNPRAPGMVNAILRSLERSLDQLPTIPQEDPAAYYGTLYSHPAWLVQELLDELGSEGAAAFFQANNSQPPMTAMVNTVRAGAEEVAASLEAQGVEVKPHPWLENCLILSRSGSVEELEAFQKGLFYIQDPASRLAVLASGAAAGMRVLDVCAAPGGKSFAAAIQMEDRGEVVSCDLHPHKKTLIHRGAERLGLSCVQALTADGKVRRTEWEGGFDLVLVDAPCSGLGVIRKKPDIRYKDPEPLASLPAVQSAILDNACAYVKPGGVLLYSTCTILRRENQAVTDRFLEEHPGFVREGFSLPGPAGEVPEGQLTLWPQVHGTDGFYLCRLRKEG